MLVNARQKSLQRMRNPGLQKKTPSIGSLLSVGVERFELSTSRTRTVRWKVATWDNIMFELQEICGVRLIGMCAKIKSLEYPPVQVDFRLLLPFPETLEQDIDIQLLL